MGRLYHRVLRECDRLGCNRALARVVKPFTPACSVVLAYHNVGFERNDIGTIEPASLASQLQTLQTLGFTNVPAEKVWSGDLRRASSHKQFAITFDDGRDGVYHYALPILRKLGCTATLFVIPEFIGTVKHFSYAKTPPTWITERELERYNGLILRYMDEGQIRDWIAAGNRIGSHSRTHQHLPCLDDRELQYELRRSRELLAERFGVAITEFAYPYGEYNERVLHATSQEYDAAYVLNDRAVVGHQRAHELPRVQPGVSGTHLLLRLGLKGGLWRHNGIA